MVLEQGHRSLLASVVVARYRSRFLKNFHFRIQCQHQRLGLESEYHRVRQGSPPSNVDFFRRDRTIPSNRYCTLDSRSCYCFPVKVANNVLESDSLCGSFDGRSCSQKGECHIKSRFHGNYKSAHCVKAFILAKSDDKYSRIVSRVHGMLFLSTPHKGSNYAHILNNILNAAPTTAQKIYVSELELNSTSLQDINEQFRTMCGELTLVSFYESLKTSIGPAVKRFVRVPCFPQNSHEC